MGSPTVGPSQTYCKLQSVKSKLAILQIVILWNFSNHHHFLPNPSLNLTYYLLEYS
jgi:hypothetical protein